MGKKLFIFLSVLLTLVFLGCFFSFRILNSPLGLTADEGAFGLNATLLSRTGHDENGYFMPLFVSSLEGTDWRQPVVQYYIAGFFKLFGANVFNLRFSSVVITLISSLLVFIVSRKIFGVWGAVAAAFVFVTTPLIMIHSHMGLDNIMPVPFAILWILGVLMYEKTGKKIFLVLSGISLGLGFYSYKGMRATSSVWALLTVVYLVWTEKKTAFKSVFTFIASLTPFYLAIPYIEHNYPGAIFDEQKFEWDSIYTFLYPYFSSFDISFLFIQGDATPWHSTGRHGMMLLASAPLFFIGLWEAIKKKKLWWLILAAFFTAPLLYGLVNSVHRASRLMAIIPLYSLIAALGLQKLWQFKKALAVLTVILMLVNYSDFVHYYWYKYPELTRQWFGDLSVHKDYELFAKKARELNLVPYVDSRIIGTNGISGKFYEAAYLGEETYYFLPDDVMETNGILMSVYPEITGLQRIESPLIKYSLHTY
jgi:4-amino-4-deoxy-L-arabinose transferase-like glycosyltransferase